MLPPFGAAWTSLSRPESFSRDNRTDTKKIKVNYSLLEINLFYSNIKLLHILCLPGYIFEITGSYRDAFFVAGGAIAAGSCIHSLTGLVFLSEAKEREQICEECGKENDIAIAEEKRN